MASIHVLFGWCYYMVSEIDRVDCIATDRDVVHEKEKHHTRS